MYPVFDRVSCKHSGEPGQAQGLQLLETPSANPAQGPSGSQASAPFWDSACPYFTHKMSAGCKGANTLPSSL